MPVSSALEDFAEGEWGQKYPAIAQSWRRNWSEVIPFFAFPDDVRRIIYTTNAIEALNAKLRRAVRTRGHFPTDESALKLLFLVLNLAAEGVENAATGMVHGQGPARHPVRRPLPDRLNRKCSTHGPHTEILTVPSPILLYFFSVPGQIYDH